MDGNTGVPGAISGSGVVSDMILVGAQNLKDTLLLFVVVLYMKRVIALTKSKNIRLNITCAIIASFFTFTLRFYISFIQIFVLLVIILKKYRCSLKQILLVSLILVVVLFIGTRVPSIAGELERV